jgi:plasmid maintenance system antidote protein VapI
MESTGIQVAFFQHIKSLLPEHIALVDAIADILNISNDSAYRRIRGEKPISLEEMQKLAAQYKISLDQFMHLQSDSFLFSGKLINTDNHNYENWEESILQLLQFASSFQKKHITYLAKDIPLPQQFMVPELAAFKSFYFRKSILNYDELKGKKFSLNNIQDRHFEISKKIAEVYNQIGSTDIWNIESINSTIRQIEFYREVNFFETEKEAKNLYDAVLRLIDHLEKQSELGLKFAINESPKPNAGSFYLYNNELDLGDNTVLLELDNLRVTILNHSIINFISTSDEKFNTYTYEALQNVLKKTTSISINSEKERARFFTQLRCNIINAARI